MKRKWVIVACMVVVLLGIVAVGATYFFVNRKAENGLKDLVRQANELSKGENVSTINKGNTSDKTSGWMTYTDEKYGFTFKYPDSVQVVVGDTKSTSGDIYVSLEKSYIKDLPESAPMGNDKETALSDATAISTGDASVSIGMPVKGSSKILNIDGGVAKETTTLAVLEVCNVQFKRTAYIYSNGQNPFRIAVSVIANNVDSLKVANSKYFVADASNCGGEKRWKDTETFYKDLISGKTDPISQEWYGLFNEIISTFQIVK